jgi:large subunit ribosomal protein L32
MALPKKKYSKSQQGKRRSHLKLTLPALNICPQCHSAKLAHHVCLACGSYDGRQATEVKSPKKKTT